MDDKDKHDGRAEIRLQLSDETQELTRPTESDTNQDSIVSTNRELSADIHTNCTDGYRIRQNIKYEHEPPESTQEDSENTSPATTSTQDFIDFIGVKTEMKSDLDGDGGTTNLTRRWVTCPGGILIEVKAELTPNVSEILPLEHCSENVDEKPVIDTRNSKVIEKTPTSVKHFTCDVCGKSCTCSSQLKMHERIHTGVKPFTCDSCGKSFVRSYELKIHKMTHTGMKPFTCDICGKSFVISRYLKIHEHILV